MYIKVKVKPGSRTEEVTKESSDHFTISVREKAERNQANTRVLEIVKSMYTGQSVRIIHGHQGPSKLIAIGD